MTPPAECPPPMQIEHSAALARIQATQESLTARLDSLTAQQQSNSGKLDAIHGAIVGDGDKPGLSGRVRSLEEAEGRRTWLLRAVVVSVVGILAKMILTGR